MGKAIRRRFLASCILLATAGLWARPVQAAPSKAKIMVLTSTYGVLAGTLTGLASLAFYRTPGDHLRNVAVGASLGLYTGIGLGLYLIYFDPHARPSAPVDEEEYEEDEDASAPALKPWQLSQRSLRENRQWAPGLGLGQEGQGQLGLYLRF